MLKSKRIYKKSGFTLIELMLVVTIIFVLMGFLVPKVSSYQEKVKNIKAINTAKQIQTAAMASYGDNQGKFVSDDVVENINALTSAESIDIESSSEDQNISVNYESDKKTYTVQVDADENTYIVLLGDVQIYPKLSSDE
ncbi:type II secretion system protein [Clostridium sp. DJ247]|uniref:type II secretion system protein n=1 Tax=Clostridium sp. DJ247 TaxID=2726188 RepID=UPI0016234D8C|nr:type II secretion system protein [Clostridium sp. DJ247]MBC2580309.1 type II secretion system protein [Clostridium sp. DJ247]